MEFNDLKKYQLGRRVAGAGHFSGDSLAKRDAIANKQAGDFFYLTPKISILANIAASSPNTMCIIDPKVYIFNATSISIVNAATNVVTNNVAVPLANTLRYIAKDASRIYFVSYDGSLNGALYYLDIALETVSVLNIPVGNNANSGIIYKNRIYVGAQVTGLVYIIDVPSFTLVTSLARTNPITFGVDTDRDKVYTFSGSDTLVKIISYASDAYLAATIAVAAGTTSTGAKPDGNPWVYYNNKLVALSRNTNEVKTIDTINDVILNTYAVGSIPVDALLYLCDLFVACNTSNNVYVISLDSNTISAPIAIGAKPCGAGAMVIKNNKLFIPCFGNSNIDGSVCVIDTSLQQLELIALTGTQVRNVGLVSSLNRIYTTNQASSFVNSYMYQFSQLFALQPDLTDWIDITPIGKSGDFADGVINYSADFSACFDDRSLINLGYANVLINATISDLTTFSI